MYVVIRTYSGQGAAELFDALERSEDSVRQLMEGVDGFVSYTALRTDEGGAVTAVCRDQAGAEETTRRAAAWVKDNLDVPIDPPSVTGGETVLHF